MDFGGSIQAMINSLKINAPTKRRHNFDGSSKQYENSGKQLEFKEVSDSDLAKIKGSIKSRIAKERVRAGFIVLVIFLAIGGAVFWGINSENKNKVIGDVESVSTIQLTDEEKEKVKQECISKGDELFKMGLYGESITQYNKALDYDSTSKSIKISLTRSFVYDCLYNENDCYKTRIRMQMLIRTYPKDNKALELLQMMQDNGKY